MLGVSEILWKSREGMSFPEFAYTGARTQRENWVGDIESLASLESLVNLRGL